MTHRNAPLTPQGRYRLVMRVQAGRPIAHVAAEAGIARATLSKWVARYRPRTTWDTLRRGAWGRTRDKEKGLPPSKRKAKGRLVEGQITTDWNKALAQLTTAYPDRINPYL